MKVQDLFEAPAGPDWKVLFKYRADEPNTWNSGSFIVHDYVGKERAKSAAVDFLIKKYKGKEASITRITQMPWKKV